MIYMNKELYGINVDELEFILKDTPSNNENAEKIRRAFEGGNNNVILCGNPLSGKTSASLAYAVSNVCPCGKILYTRFDRDRYLVTGMSIDTILKKSLVNHLVVNGKQGREAVECGNYLDRFESSLDSNTLLIIDDYEINAPSPYMRHLFSLECKVLVITRCDMKNIGVNAVRTDTCDVINVNPVCDFSVLDSESRELLMTLCAILFYLDNGVEIKSSKSGVFDEESVRFYVGSLADKISVLEERGFIKRTDKGRIVIERYICQRVLSEFCPTARNCPAFMSFAEKYFDFSIMQCSKDFKAKLLLRENHDIPTAAIEEMLCAYTHFSRTDAKSGGRLYNLIFVLMLDRLADRNGKYYVSHLLFRNSNYYIKTICSCLEEGRLCDALYNPDMYSSEELSLFYGNTLKTKLDIMRMSLMFIRNVTVDLYEFYQFTFKTLYDVMEAIYREEIPSCSNDSERLLILDDVIRLCYETLGYPAVTGEHGEYIPDRDCHRYHRVFYTCEKLCDELSASSVIFGYSTLTVKLYAVYQKYIDAWLSLADKSILPSGRLLSAIHKEKYDTRLALSREISMQFNRIRIGYENCCPVFLPGNEAILKPYETELDSTIEKRLSDNKRFLCRGFDGGTKCGGKRYADFVISAIREGCDILRLLVCILDYDYPLSDNTYRILCESGLSELVCQEENTANLSKQMLLETLVFRYNAKSEKKALTGLYESIIGGLFQYVSHNSASLTRLAFCVSYSYVLNKIHDTEMICESDFITRLYEKVCLCRNVNEAVSHEVLAHALYDAACGIDTVFSDKTVYGALENFAYEQIMSRNAEITEKLECVCEKLLGRDSSKKLCENISVLLYEY